MGGRGASSGTGQATAASGKAGVASRALTDAQIDALEPNAEAYMNEVSIDNVTQTEKRILRDYTDALYVDANQMLRGKLKEANASARVKDSVKAMDEVFNKVPRTTRDMVVYRGIEKHPGLAKAFDSGKIVGTTISDKAFQSTTRSKKIASELGEGGGISMRIVVPKGSKAIPIEKVSSFKLEREILLDRNASYRVLSAKKVGKSRQITVELLS